MALKDIKIIAQQLKTIIDRLRMKAANGLILN